MEAKKQKTNQKLTIVKTGASASALATPKTSAEKILEEDIVALGRSEKLKRLRWSVWVRYLVTTAVAVISLIAYGLGFEFNLIGILIGVTIAFLFNLTSHVVYNGEGYPRFWPYLGIFLDMVVITVIVHASGGVASIFLPLYLLQLVGTNVHFSTYAAPLNLLFGGTLLSGLLIGEFTGFLPHTDVGILPLDLYTNRTFIVGVGFTMITLMGISTYRSGYVVRSLQTVEVELLKANHELVRLNKIYSKVNQRLKEIDQMKTEFISVASHQMRTPLSGVKWVLRMVLDGDLGELTSQQREMLNKGYHTNERMILLINDLLNVSRIEEGRFQYRFIHGSLEEVAERVVTDMRQAIEGRGIALLYEGPKQALAKVNMDPDKIQLVIQNLVDNAVKYTPQGGKIVVSVKPREHAVECSVADSGVGIPADQRGKIFSKFFRADNVIRMQTDGSGLGLFIAKSIVDNHRGSIWFESTEGLGTTFFFDLPVNPPGEQRKQFEQFIKSI